MYTYIRTYVPLWHAILAEKLNLADWWMYMKREIVHSGVVLFLVRMILHCVQERGKYFEKGVYIRMSKLNSAKRLPQYWVTFAQRLIDISPPNYNQPKNQK